MSGDSYNRDTFMRLYQIGGADLALRYADMASESRSSLSDEGSSSVELEVVGLRFYAGPSRNPPVSERIYETRFPHHSTQYIYTQIDMRSPWKAASFKYSLLTRYYRPGGSLMAESKTSIKTNPEWDTFWHTERWGWETPGIWMPGTYRVDVHIYGDLQAAAEFIVYQEADRKLFDPSRFQLFRGLGYTSGRNWPWEPRDWSAKTESGDSAPEIDDDPPQEEPLTLGFEGWLNRMNDMYPKNTARNDRPAPEPLTDLQAMQRLIEIDGRYLVVMPRIMPGLASEESLQELKNIAADYQDLLEHTPVGNQFFTQDDVRKKIADTLNFAGHMAVTLRDYPEARGHYASAVGMYASLGHMDDVARINANLAELDLTEEGNVNKEMTRLRSELAALPGDSLEHADILVQLAALYSGSGDDFEARKLFHQAETLLNAKFPDPGGGDLAGALTRTLLRMSGNDPEPDLPSIETMMEVRGLYKQLYLGLARSYQDIDPDEAERYRAKAERPDDRANNDEFSDLMRRALSGDLGDLE